MSASTKKKAVPTKKKAKAKVTKTKKVVKEAPVEEKPKKAAPKVKKAEEKKEAPARTTPKVARLKLGPPPLAMVSVRDTNSGSPYERAARGFSFGELESADVPVKGAREGHLSLDIRRRSVVQANVEMLKRWLKSPATAAPRGTMEKPVAVVAGKKK